MNRHHDPVDSALDLLRSQQWTARNLNPELENKLMRQFDENKTSAPRFAQPRTLGLALALVAMGGVAFAATGGIQTVKGWFVTVEINGESFDLELDENGIGEIEVETADGGTANVYIEKTTEPDSETITAYVDITGGAAQTQQVIEIVSGRGKRGTPRPKPIMTVADLGDAKPVKTWSDKSGLTHELYILPGNTEGTTSHIVRTQRDGEKARQVEFLGTAPSSLFDKDADLFVEVAGGFLTIRLESDDNVEMMKFVLDPAAAVETMKRQGPGGPVSIDHEKGEITITLDGDERPAD